MTPLRQRMLEDMQFATGRTTQESSPGAGVAGLLKSREKPC